MHHTIPEIPIHKKFAKFGKRKKSDKLLRLYARLINSTQKWWRMESAHHPNERYWWVDGKGERVCSIKQNKIKQKTVSKFHQTIQRVCCVQNGKEHTQRIVCGVFVMQTWFTSTQCRTECKLLKFKVIITNFVVAVFFCCWNLLSMNELVLKTKFAYKVYPTRGLMNNKEWSISMIYFQSSKNIVLSTCSISHDLITKVIVMITGFKCHRLNMMTHKLMTNKHCNESY